MQARQALRCQATKSRRASCSIFVKPVRVERASSESLRGERDSSSSRLLARTTTPAHLSLSLLPASSTNHRCSCQVRTKQVTFRQHHHPLLLLLLLLVLHFLQTIPGDLGRRKLFDNAAGWQMFSKKSNINLLSSSMERLIFCAF